MSEFNKAVDELAENIKTSEQIISKDALADSIREMELLLDDMRQNPLQNDFWYRRVVGDNLRTLRMVYRNLGYE